MKSNNRIERRVFLIFGGFTFVLCLGYSIISLVFSFIVEDSILEKILANEARYLKSSFQQTKQVPQSRVDYMVLYTDLANAPQDVIDARLKTPTIGEVFTENNHHYHLLDLVFVDNETGQRVDALLVAEVTEFLSVTNRPKQLFKLSIILLVLALLLAIWPAYRISKRAIKPLTLLAKDVRNQREQQLPMDLSRYQNDDEIEYLASTIEQSINELGESLKRETHFNRDVSHELRTPLTVISNMLALAERRELNPTDIQQMRISTEKMREIVETLLALARLESVVLQPVNLRAVLEESVLSSMQKNEESFDVHLDVSEEFLVRGNNRLLTLLFNNLIENAKNHSSSQKLEVRLDGHVLSFKNTVKAEFEKSTAQLMKPNVMQADSSGIGQGLYLVERIATALGWKLEIEVIDGTYSLRIYF
ncbi:MAG: HAMP domain-containing histidine kinase [Kangiellaceae bacterium]|nr:HAMP domain-containing histidine kinase [Kangiellaceae bacterium]